LFQLLFCYLLLSSFLFTLLLNLFLVFLPPSPQVLFLFLFLFHICFFSFVAILSISFAQPYMLNLPSDLPRLPLLMHLDKHNIHLNLHSKKKVSGTHWEVWERIITFALHVDIKYTNKQSLGRKGVGTAFPRVPADKAMNNACTNHVRLYSFTMPKIILSHSECPT